MLGPGRATNGLRPRFAGADEELAVAFSAPYGALGDTLDPPTLFRLEPGSDAVNDLLMQVWVPDDATLADAALADLELGLDQGDQMSPRAGQIQHRGQDRFEANEAGIADHQVHLFRHLFAGEVTRIDSFQHFDAGIIAQLPGKLPRMSHSGTRNRLDLRAGLSPPPSGT